MISTIRSTYAQLNYGSSDVSKKVVDRDLSGDGQLDLAVACGTAKRRQFFVQVGDLVFAQSPRSYEVGRGCFVGDLSGDRKADVLLTESPVNPLLLLNTSK